MAKFYGTFGPQRFMGSLPASDTVSYEGVPLVSGIDIGDYTTGVIASLDTGVGTFGWALGDIYISIENIVGTQHTDTLTGNSLANVLDGGGSPDFIYGRSGNDTVLGGGGFDFLYGEGGNDVMDGQWQTDEMHGGDGHDQMWGGSNFISRYYPGTDYSDVLYGDAGNDQLHGDVRLPANNGPTEYYQPQDSMPGHDELHGGSGNDTLNGDGGNDELWGDGGTDTFRFDAPYTVKDSYGSNMRIRSGDDVIHDFRKGEDRIGLRGYALTDLRIQTSDADGDGAVDDSVIQFDAAGRFTNADSVVVYNVTGLTSSQSYFVIIA